MLGNLLMHGKSKIFVMSVGHDRVNSLSGETLKVSI